MTLTGCLCVSDVVMVGVCLGRMGLDGVVPGVAYTLLTKSSLTDKTFSVFLVKLLHDANQHTSVTPELMQFAQSDPQWQRVMSGGGAAGRGKSGRQQGTAGLGLGYSAPGSSGHQKAMTSSMLAEMSAGGSVSHPSSTSMGLTDMGVAKAYEKLVHSRTISANGSESASVQAVSSAGSGEMAPNPYIEGRTMGRGKHMTQPSWAPPAVYKTTIPDSRGGEGEFSSGQFGDALEKQSGSEHLESEPIVKKRKNRFSELFSEPPSAPSAAAPPVYSSNAVSNDYHVVTQSTYVPPPVPQSNPLPGFVRASGAGGGLSSVGSSQQVSSFSGSYSGGGNGERDVGGSSRVRKSRWE